jgi:Spy/CpxP family protein refolding chaperone
MRQIGLILLLACGSALAQQALEQQALEQQVQLAARQAELARMKTIEAQLARLLATGSGSNREVLELSAQLERMLREDAKIAPAIAAGNWAPYGKPPARPEKWWNDPNAVAQAGLTKDQQRKMDDVFLQYRLKLIDMNAALEKEEVALEPLLGADSLDEAKIAAEIDRVAQARAELEKANGRMLLGIRMVLTPEQWKKMQK